MSKNSASGVTVCTVLLLYINVHYVTKKQHDGPGLLINVDGSTTLFKDTFTKNVFRFSEAFSACLAPKFAKLSSKKIFLKSISVFTNAEVFAYSKTVKKF
jgi:hypothetical protein